MEKEETSHYFFLGLLAVVALVSIMIVFPFFTSIVGGGILAFIFYPLYSWVQQRVRSKGVAAFLISLFIIILIAIPTIVSINTIAQETQYFYYRTKQQLSMGLLIENGCYEDSFLCHLITNANQLLRDEKVRAYLLTILNDFITFVTNRVSNLIVSIPQIALSLLVTLFTTYYLLKDGKEYLHRITRVIPLKVHHQDQVINQFSDVTYALIYGTLIVALIQGTVGAIGFWIFGIEGFIWWGLLMTLFALVPFVGCALVWVPASAYLALEGYAQGQTALLWKGIGLFFYGLFLISTIDNIVKPFIIAGRVRVHPLLVLVGVLGGISLFGIIGIVIGPFFLTLLQTLIEIYERERKPHLTHDSCIIGKHNGKHHPL